MSGGPEKPETKAARLGRRVVYPEPNELFVDVDSQEQFDQCMKILPVLREHGVLSPESRWSRAPSPSGLPGRYHVTIQDCDARVFDPHTRILLQALLGSDPMREALSLVQFRSGEPNPVVFFELPEPVPINPFESLEVWP